MNEMFRSELDEIHRLLQSALTTLNVVYGKVDALNRVLSMGGERCNDTSSTTPS